MSLLVSLHDVAPPFLAGLARVRERLGRLGVNRVTLLVVPDYHGRHPIEDARDFCGWLRARAAAGDEVVLHGRRHQQEGGFATLADGLRAALWTAGEGECLTLDGTRRQAMLQEGKQRLERLIGQPVRGFVAPAWLEPRGFGAHLAAAGFAWHEGGLWVEALVPTRPRRIRTPVIGFATRSRARRAAALAWANLTTTHLLRRARIQGSAGDAPPLARVAIHPADLEHPPVLAAAERCIARLLVRFEPATYAGALGLGAAA